MPSGTLEKLAKIVSTSLAGLETLLTPEHASAYFEQLGTRFPDSFNADVDVRGALSTASTRAGGFASILTSFSDAERTGDTAGIIAAGAQLIVGIGVFLEALGSVAGQIEAKSWPPLTDTEVRAFTQGLAKRILEDAILRHVEANRPEFVSAGILLGIADRFSIPITGADATEFPVFSRQLQLGRLGDALGSTKEHFRSLVGWGDSPFDPSRLLQRLQALQTLFTNNTLVDTR